MASFSKKAFHSIKFFKDIFDFECLCKWQGLEEPLAAPRQLLTKGGMSFLLRGTCGEQA